MSSLVNALRFLSPQVIVTGFPHYQYSNEIQQSRHLQAGRADLSAWGVVLSVGYQTRSTSGHPRAR
jgi:hypothetical protein